MSKVSVGAKTLQDLNKIQSEIVDLKSLIKTTEHSIEKLADNRKNEFFMLEVRNLNYRQKLDPTSEDILKNYLAAYESDILRAVEMRLESKVRGWKNQVRMKEDQLKLFFENE